MALLTKIDSSKKCKNTENALAYLSGVWVTAKNIHNIDTRQCCSMQGMLAEKESSVLISPLIRLYCAGSPSHRNLTCIEQANSVLSNLQKVKKVKVTNITRYVFKKNIKPST